MAQLSSVMITPTAYACTLLPYSTLIAPMYIKTKSSPSCLSLNSGTSSGTGTGGSGTGTGSGGGTGGGGGSSTTNVTIFVTQSVTSTALANIWYYSAPIAFTSLFKNVVSAYLGVFPSAVTVSTLPGIPSFLHCDTPYFPLRF